MRLPGSRRAPLAQVVRAELGHIARPRRALMLTKLTVLSGFSAAPWWMTGTLAVSLGGAVASVSYPLGYRLMVNGAVHHQTGEIVTATVVTALIFGLYWALTILGGIQAAGLTDRVNIWLSTRMGGLIASIPDLAHFERPDYLAEVDLLTKNRRALAASPRLAVNLFLTFVQTAVAAVLLATIYPLFALLPLAGLAPLLGDDAAVRLQERATQRLAERTRLADELYTALTTAVPANELRVCGVQDELRGRWETVARQQRRATARATLAGLACSAVGWTIYALVFGGAIALLAVQAVRGTASIGDVVMAIALIRRLQNQVNGLSDAFGQMITGFRLGLRLLWLEIAADRGRRPAASLTSWQPPLSLETGIVFDHVDFAYPGTGQLVLKDVSLRVPTGATVAIVGENGAGKSTLVKLLMKLYEPTSGRILVDGRCLADIAAEDWRSRCTAAFQDFARFELRAGHIVSVGELARLDDDEAVRTALAAADGLDVIGSLNAGLDTEVGRTFPAGRELSGGQWQKLALARGAFRAGPLVAVLDEPTANLDAKAEAAVFARMARTARHTKQSGAVTIFVSHRFTSARIADLIVLLEQGTVAEVGDHRSLMAKGGSYAEMFALQARAYR